MDIFKTMGQRAFGGAAQSGKRTCSPTAVTPPKRPAAAPKPNGLPQGHRSSDPAPPAQQLQDPPVAGEKSPPPFFLDPTPEWPTIAAKLKELTGGDVVAYVRGDFIRVKTSTAAHFRAIQRHLMTAKVPFHTFNVGGSRSLKVVISGLPTTVTDVDLADALGAENLSVAYVCRLRSRTGLSNRWVVTFVPDSERDDGAKRASHVYKVPELFHVRISVEVFKKPPGPPQCHHCQGFGHGSSHCGRPLRCVRCGEAHTAYNCKRPAEEKGKCCNCGGDHNANWRGCPTFQAAKAAAANRQPKYRPEKKPAAQPPTAQAPCPAEEAEKSPTEDEQGFAPVKKRRKRQPRNPANRQTRSSPAPQQPPPAEQPTAEPTERPSPTEQPRPRKLPRPPPQPATPAETPADRARPKLENILASLMAIVQQLTTVAGLLADLAKDQ